VPVELNHTIVPARDQVASASFLAEILGLPAPSAFGHFTEVQLEHGLTLDFATTRGEIQPQHYAFLITEDEFDEIFGRIRERGVRHWADPGQTQPNEINTHDGGRGVYFQDPDGHLLEIITRPYGKGS
jgi:catechol 2,3-dioxygenase-like lactoylglutathione lyase family enzyme